jgi:hypothetical protein
MARGKPQSDSSRENVDISFSVSLKQQDQSGWHRSQHRASLIRSAGDRFDKLMNCAANMGRIRRPNGSHELSQRYNGLTDSWLGCIALSSTSKKTLRQRVLPKGPALEKAALMERVFKYINLLGAPISETIAVGAHPPTQ